MKKHTLLMFGLVTLVATATTHAGGQDQLAQSIQDAHLETTRTADQLKSTLGPLNALTKQTKGDLPPAYTTYCSEVTKTDSAAGVTRARVQWMGSDGRKYFQDWQTSVNDIANESLRKEAQKRLDAVKTSYTK